MAALSWNALMGFVGFSAGPTSTPTFDLYQVLRTDGCSFRKVQYCSIVQSLFQVTGVRRNDIVAGGNGRFGRRDFVWQGGRDLVLRYQRLNVLGFSMDFAEDVTKSNWGVEFTWENDAFEGNNDAYLGYTPVDRYNLTISVDRPTFVNFLNANRTFFINSQWFFQYVDGYGSAFTSNGPFNVLAVLAVEHRLLRRSPAAEPDARLRLRLELGRRRPPGDLPVQRGLLGDGRARRVHGPRGAARRCRSTRPRSARGPAATPTWTTSKTGSPSSGTGTRRSLRIRYTF